MSTRAKVRTYAFLNSLTVSNVLEQMLMKSLGEMEND